MLVSQPIPGLYNGVSQQPASLRLSTQCENQENAYGTLVDGLYKRPNTEFIAVLSTVAANGAFIHEINRDAVERYIMVVTNVPAAPIEIFTLDGTKCTIRYGHLDENFNFTPDASVINYINTGGGTLPRERFKAVTVADHTILVNSRVTVRFDLSESLEIKVNEAFLWIKIAALGTKYRIIVDDHVGNHTTDETNPEHTDFIAGSLLNSIKAHGDFTDDFNIEQRGSVLRVTRKDGGDFLFYSSDGYGDQGSKGIKGYVSKFSDLPPRCWNGARVRVKQDEDGENADYYVQFDSSESGGDREGVWKESRGWSQYNKFDPLSMPHRIVRTGTNEFTVAPIIWEERLVGDEDTAPTPSFVWSQINDVFFFRNRLGFLSQDNCILSRAGDYFNFWPKTALDVLDDDPIDIAASGSEPSVVTTLRYARPFESNLMLVSDQVQFSLSSGSAATLTPQTVVVDSTTHFVAAPDCAPVSAGANLYFLSPGANYSRLREYFVQPDSLITDAADVTGHVPSYLPTGPASMRACNSLDVIFLQFKNVPNVLYLYKFYWQGTDKVQSAWCKWAFWETIIGMAVFDTTLYLIVLDSGAGQARLVKINLDRANTGNLPFKVHLDNLVQLQGQYNSGYDLTIWTLPYNDSVPDGWWVVVDPVTGLPVNGVQKTSGTTLQVSGNFSGASYYIGKVYTMRYQFSEIFLRDSQDIPRIGGYLQLRTLTLSCQGTGYYRLEVTPENRDTMVHEYSGVEVGASTIGAPAIVDGPQKFMVMTKATKTKLELINDTYLPCSFQTANIEGYFVQRSRLL